MDVSNLIAASTSSSEKLSTEVTKEIPLTVDSGLLAVFDYNEIDEAAYKENTEEYLQATARDGVQALINALFSLPIEKSGDGPLAILPPITTLLPRAKPLPKPKPPTKWEQFAATKGIQKKGREKKIWDEERQEWVNRWGRAGKNREAEEQWATPIPANAPDDFDPAKVARDERKARVAKNEKQRLANISRAQGEAPGSKEERKAALNKQILQTRVSTGSMGKFDKKLEGEPKLRGIKRKFEANEVSASDEHKSALAIASKIGAAPSKKARTDGTAKEPVLNVRKAVRHASGGRGAIAMVGEKSGSGRGGRGGRGGGSGRGRGKSDRGRR